MRKKHNAVIEQELRCPGVWEIVQLEIVHEYSDRDWRDIHVSWAIDRLMEGTVPTRLSRGGWVTRAPGTQPLIGADGEDVQGSSAIVALFRRVRVLHKRRYYGR